MAAMSGPVLTMWFCDIENEKFSMWTVDGMFARRSYRSECGVVEVWSVGSWWYMGWTASVASYSALSGLWGAGRARGWYASSISVSVEGAGRFRGVFLVVGDILQYKR
jgi:hypothetical protein